MQVSTGNVATDREWKVLREQPGYDPSDWVELRGTAPQVEALSAKVRLGTAEMERRKKRRQQQKNSRKKNR